MLYPGLSTSLNKLCMRPYKWYNWKMTDDILKLPCDLVWWTAKQPEKPHLRTDINPWKKKFWWSNLQLIKVKILATLIPRETFFRWRTLNVWAREQNRKCCKDFKESNSNVLLRISAQELKIEITTTDCSAENLKPNADNSNTWTLHCCLYLADGWYIDLNTG